MQIALFCIRILPQKISQTCQLKLKWTVNFHKSLHTIMYSLRWLEHSPVFSAKFQRNFAVSV